MGLERTVKSALGRIRGTAAGAKLGNNVYIGLHVHITRGSNLTLEDDVQVRPNCDLFAGENGLKIGKRSDVGTRNRIDGDVTLGEGVLLGPDNYISSEDHCYEDIAKAVMDQGTYSPHKNGHNRLVIGDDSWIGCHCAIIGDVHIGRHCVIGANSVVTRDVPDYCVVAGAPARVLRRYDRRTKVWVRDDQ